MLRSIRFHLYLVFGVLAALVVMIAAFEVAGANDIGWAIDKLAGNSIETIQSLSRIGKLAADIRVADGRAILGDTVALQNEALEEARTRTARFQREVGRYAALAANAQELLLFETLSARADALVVAQGDFERSFVEPGGSPVDWYRHEGRQAYDRTQEAIQALIAENDRKTEWDVAGARIERRHLSLVAAGMLVLTLLLTLSTVIYVGGRIIEPLAALTAAMRRLAQAEWATEVPATDRGDEIGEMARAIQAFRRQGMAGEQATLALRTLNADLERLAMVDPLTGVANRRYFYQRAAIEIGAAHRRHAPLACLMLDIDFFKSVNDRHGHAAGDAVLKRLAETVQAGIRPYDLFGRLGGEEFAILLPDADLATASLIAERLRIAVAASPALVEGEVLPITVSIGVAILAAEDAAIDPLLDRADRALYQAKEGGRNRVVGPRSDLPPPALVSGR